MATRTWTGAAQDGSFSNTSNWSAAVVPVTGDSVIVSATATYGMSANLDRSADGVGAGLNLVSFEIEKGFAYDIGSLSAPLRLTADKFSDYGNGNLYFSTDTGTAALPTDRVIIDKDDISKIVYLLGQISGGADSTFTIIEITRGANVYLGDGTNGLGSAVTSLWVTPRYRHTDVKVTANANFDVTTCHMSGGYFIHDGGPVTTFNLDNGTLEFRSTTLATLNQGGGLVIHNGEASSYAITTYNAKNGYMRSDDTAGTKLISTLNRAPMWDMKYNPKLTVSTTNYIGG